MTASGLGGEKVMRPILDDFLGAVPTVPAQLLLGELKRSEARAAGILDSALDFAL